MADQTEAKTEPAKVRKIHPSRCKLAEGARNIWQIVPEEGVSFDDLLDPAYWTHIADRLRPTDRIEVVPEDGSYFAELLVRSQGRMTAKVVVLRKVDLGAPEASAPTLGFDVLWKGAHHKHAVVRLRDKSVMQAGFEAKEAALAWLAANARTLAN